MLILTRNVGQSIHIGDDIQVKILGCRGSHIRIGIVAPESVPIYREEIYHRIQIEKAALDNATDNTGTVRYIKK